MTNPPRANNKDMTTLTERSGFAAAADIRRGVQRLLSCHGVETISEFCLANGRRADVCGVGLDGQLWIVEIKSSISDFRTDQKWPEYRDYCDRLFFAVAPEFPTEILPADTGLILADRYGGEIIKDAPEFRLSGARRKAVMLQFARVAALRLQTLLDPQDM